MVTRKKAEEKGLLDEYLSPLVPHSRAIPVTSGKGWDVDMHDPRASSPTPKGKQRQCHQVPCTEFVNSLSPLQPSWWPMELMAAVCTLPVGCDVGAEVKLPACF